MTAGKHLLVYDGACGLCKRSVEWAMARGAGEAFEAVPFQTAPEPPMTPELRAACEKAVHVITTDGRVLRAGPAALFVLGHAGHPHLARGLALPPMRWAVAAGYRVVAANRPFFARLLFRRRR